LKTLALNRIRYELGKCDIVEEAFSRFASQWAGYITKLDYLLTESHRYDEVRKLYVEQLAHVWMKDTTETIHASVDRKIDCFVDEGLEHATETLSALWKIANKGGDAKAPANTSSVVSLCCYPPQLS